MPDISKCSNKTCNLRTTCYRFTSEDSEYRQSYSDFKFNKDGSCDWLYTRLEKLFNFQTQEDKVKEKEWRNSTGGV